MIIAISTHQKVYILEYSTEHAGPFPLFSVSSYCWLQIWSCTEWMGVFKGALGSVANKAFANVQ